MASRILIVDDSAMIRSVIRSRIERQADWQVCGEAENGAIAINKVKELNPDVVVLDFQMPVMNGLDAAAEISKMTSEPIMVMFTLHKDEYLAKSAEKAGIKGVVAKSGAMLEDLVNAIDHLLRQRKMGSGQAPPEGNPAD